jgi:hypothetical protein
MSIGNSEFCRKLFVFNELVDSLPKRQPISVCFISQLNRAYPIISADTSDHGAVNGRATGLLQVCTARKQVGVGIGTDNCERYRALNGKETGVYYSCERCRYV